MNTTTCPRCGYNLPFHDSSCSAVVNVLACGRHLPADAKNVRSTDDARSRSCTTCGEHATYVHSV